MKLKLRGHHLLCLQGFQGYGYDEDFVENMCEINRLRKLEDTSIKVVNSPDDICKACPNLVDNKCIDDKNNDKIIAMDNVVLSKIAYGFKLIISKNLLFSFGIPVQIITGIR